MAAKIGIDRQGLVETVARFNGFARAGKDFDFDRGYSAYERYMGDMVSPVSGPGGTVGPGMACLAGIHAAGEAHKQK